MASEGIKAGIAAYKLGDKATAGRILAEVVSDEPANEAAWLWLSACLEDTEQKKFCFERVLKINPNNQTARQALGLLTAPEPSWSEIETSLHSQGTSTNEVSSVSKVKEEPGGLILRALKCPMCGGHVKAQERECDYCGSSLVIVSLGGASVQNLDSATMTASLAKWRDILKHDPSNAEANYALGLTYLNQGLRDAALPLLRKAVQCAPEEALVHYNLALALFNDGKVRGASKEYEELVVEIGHAHRLNPDFAEAKAFQKCFLAYRLTAVDVSAAAKEYVAAIQICPDIAVFHNNLGTCYCEMGNYAAAEPALRKAMEIDPDDSGAVDNMCALFLKQGKCDDAVQHGKRALELSRSLQDQAHALNNLGSCYQQAKNHSIAEQYFRKAVEINPEYGAAYVNLCAISYTLKKFEEGIKCGRKAVELIESSPEDQARGYYHLGMCYSGVGNNAAAEQALRKAMEIDPESGDAYLGLSALCLRLGRYDEVIQCSRKAIDLNKATDTQALSYYMLGFGLWQKGQKREAIQMTKKAIALQPQQELYRSSLQRIQKGH